MQFKALVAALGLLFACGIEPDPPDRPRIEAVSIAPFATQHLIEFKVSDPGTTYMQRLVDDVALDRERGRIAGETERWTTPGGRPIEDIYLAAPTRAELERYLVREPSLTLPVDHELAFGRLDDGRWRTYVVPTRTDLDGDSITSVELTRDPAGHPRVWIELTRDGAERFHAITANAVGMQLAVLAEGTVVAAPVIVEAVRGGRAELTLPGLTL
jgi:hypothetical protein